MSPARFVSTGQSSPPVELTTALLEGLAPDGGLYMPEALSPLTSVGLSELKGGSLRETAERLIAPLFGRDAPAATHAAVIDALDFDVPLVQLSDRLFVLELFHGPTLAFKDVGARVMARLLGQAGSGGPIFVIAATSGDTGGAVAHAFARVSGTRVWILYPKKQVSERQERQFATVGGNVQAVAVRGTFDDCQRLAKGALGDRQFLDGAPLTSANSINVGRLLPQAIYYAHGWAQLPGGSEVVVSVPSGNFGNLTAGLMAKRCGVPIDRFVAATNANDVFGHYLRTGAVNPRESVRTLSSAMDVGNPSNLVRIHYLYDGDLGGLQRDVAHSAHGDADVRLAIRRVADELGYVLDPHTAVGLLALESELRERPDAVGIVLATAHPAKFADVVEPILGRAVDIPPRLAATLARSVEAVEIAPTLRQLRDTMQGG